MIKADATHQSRETGKVDRCCFVDGEVNPYRREIHARHLPISGDEQGQAQSRWDLRDAKVLHGLHNSWAVDTAPTFAQSPPSVDALRFNAECGGHLPVDGSCYETDHSSNKSLLRRPPIHRVGRIIRSIPINQVRILLIT